MIEPRFRWRLPSPVDARSAGLRRGRRARPGFSARLVGAARRAAAIDRSGRARRVPRAGRARASTTRPACRTPTALSSGSTGRDRAGERVLVFGDFDADGLTGLAILVRALRALRARRRAVRPEPARRGPRALSLRAVDAAATAGRPLIVTVDTGSIERGRDRRGRPARDRRPRHRPPPGAAGAARRRSRSSTRTGPTATYPDPRLAGSGVAFKVAQLLLAGVPGGPERALDLAELATIGTVADVAPILGENRAIARLGLERLRTAPLPGLAALLELGRRRRRGRSTSRPSPSSIAPRLNAAGRVGEALDAAALLLTDDPAEATELADRLEAANLARRELTRRRAIAEAQAVARRRPRRSPAATVVRGDWPVGVIGLVAGRLAEERGRPAVVGTELDGVIRASCRSAGRVRPRGGAGRLRRPVRPPRRPPRRGRVRAGGRPLGRLPRALPGPRHGRRCRRRPMGGPSSASTWSSPAPEVDYALLARAPSARPDRAGEPRSARRRRGPDRDPCPRRERRPHPADAAQAARRRRRDRLRPRRPGRGRPRGRPARRRRAGRHPALRRLRVAPARDPRRRAGGPRRGAGGGSGGTDAGEPLRRRDRFGDPPDRAASGSTAASARPDPYGIGPTGTLVAPVAGDGRAGRGRRSSRSPCSAARCPLPGRRLGLGQRRRRTAAAAASDRSARPRRRTSSSSTRGPNIPGTLVYVKQGNLWIQTGNKATQITTSGAGSMPSWSPDGQWIYYIESVHDQGYFPQRQPTARPATRWTTRC